MADAGVSMSDLQAVTAPSPVPGAAGPPSAGVTGPSAISVSLPPAGSVPSPSWGGVSVRAGLTSRGVSSRPAFRVKMKSPQVESGSLCF